MIDGKGRIFGLVNIIDLFILAALIAVAVYMFGKTASPGTGTPKQSAYIMKFYTENSPEYAVKLIEKDVPAEDDTKGISLGTVKDYTIGQGIVYNYDKNGNSVKAFMEDYASCEVVLELNGQVMESGSLLVNGNVYAIGQPITIRAGKIKLFGKISGLEAAE